MHTLRYLTRLLPLLLITLAMAGCGGSNTPSALSTPDGSALPDAAEAAGEFREISAGFSLRVLPESFYGGASADLGLRVEESAEQVVVRVEATEAHNLRALYMALDYEPSLYRPVEAEPSAAFGPAEELLTLTIAQEQGTVHHGQVLVHPQDQAGFSGNGEIAVLRFAKSPDPLRRVVSQAPASDLSAAQLTFDEQNAQLVWGYTSQGDYDQNSETNIADLTPIGVHFKKGGGPFEYFTIESVVDGDNNGEINIADITPIGVNFQRRVNSYNVFQSQTPETDFPATNDAFSTIDPEISIGYQNFEGNRGSERVRYSFDLNGAPQNTTYWVRPVDGQSLGTPSNQSEVPFLTAPVPTADLTATPDSGFVPLVVDFDATGSTSPVGVLSNFEWDFDNDGTFNEADNGEDLAQGNPTASFTFLVPGTYDVIVRVSNEFGFSNVAGASVSANQVPNEAPVAAISASPLSGKAPLNVTFDASGSSDADGSIVEYEWDFNGDGIFDESTGTTPTVQHLFSLPGSFDVQVRVKDDDGASDTASMLESGQGVISINPPNEAPSASIAADVTNGTLPLTVNFDATGSTDNDGNIVSYEWDFEGDGVFETNSGTDATVQHIYNASGDFDPAVRVTDDDGATDTASLSDTIPGGISANEAPSASISADLSSGPIPLTVNFDASASTDSDGTIVNYQWDFDGDDVMDLDTGNNPTTMFIYNSAGDFDPQVMVTDDDGASDIASLSESGGNPITANDPPVAAIAADTLSGPVPLTVNFDASASTDSDGTVVNYEWDFEGDGIYDLDTDGAATAQFIYIAGGSYDPTVRITDNEGATDTASISENGDGDIIAEGGPEAALTADPTSGDAPLVVDFDASASTSDGTITSFEWDFENDGVFELNTGTTPTASHVYGVLGAHTATVRVTDDTPGTDTASAVITLNSGWDIDNSLVTVGIDSKASIETFADGDENARVALAYKDAATDDLYFIRSTDASGLVWGDPIVVLSAGQVGNDATLREVDGNPAISFRRAASKLDYIRATASDGSSWPATSIEIDGGGGAGAFTSLAVVNGNPAVSNIKAGQDDLRFARASDSTGAAWAAPIDVEAGIGGGDEIEFTDLFTINGRPAIVFNFVGDDTGLKFARANDANGSSFASPVQINAPVAGGRYPSLRVVEGNPATSYQAFSVDELRYKRADNADGTSWSSHVVVDSGADIGEWTTLRIVNGVPAISYYEPDGGNLKYALASDSQGTAWTPMYVDTAGDVGKFATMTVINDAPVIAYYDVTSGSLKVAVFVP